MDPHINPFEVCFPHQNLYLFSHITIYNFYNIINYGTLFCFVLFFSPSAAQRDDNRKQPQ